MIAIEEYGNIPTYDFEDIGKIKEEIGLQTKYEVSLIGSTNDSFITIKENGNIEMFVDHMLGIKIDKNNHSINASASNINLNGDTNIVALHKNGGIEISSDYNNSYLSQKADFIGINSERTTVIGNEFKNKDTSVTLTADTVEIIANKFLVNGKEIK